MSLSNLIKTHASGVDGQQGVGRWCVVQGVDAPNHLIRVSIEPEHSINMQSGGPPVMSGWIPAPSGNTTGGWSESCLPAIGQQVFCMPEMGDGEHLVAIQAGYTAENAPPQAASEPNAAGGDAPASTPAQAGERMFTHTSGAVMRLCADGSVFWKAALKIEGPVTIVGDLTLAKGGSGGNGSITTAGTIAASDVISSTTEVTAGSSPIHLTTHKHTSEDPGSPTSPPIAGT